MYKYVKIKFILFYIYIIIVLFFDWLYVFGQFRSVIVLVCLNVFICRYIVLLYNFFLFFSFFEFLELFRVMILSEVVQKYEELLRKLGGDNYSDRTGLDCVFSFRFSFYSDVYVFCIFQQRVQVCSRKCWLNL